MKTGRNMVDAIAGVLALGRKRGVANTSAVDSSRRWLSHDMRTKQGRAEGSASRSGTTRSGLGAISIGPRSSSIRAKFPLTCWLALLSPLSVPPLSFGPRR